MYYFYDSGELRGPFSIHELRSKVNGDELVRNERNQWQAAQDIEGWDAVSATSADSSEENQNEVLMDSGILTGKGRTIEPISVGGMKIVSEGVHSSDGTQGIDNFKYEEPSRFWRYFGYDDEYISGGTYLGRTILQYFTIPFFGLGFFLWIVTIYKRARSLGYDAGAGFISAILGINLLWAFGENLSTKSNHYYNQPEPEISEPALLFGIGCLILHWWLVFKNSRAVMLGGPKALLQRLRVTSLERRKEILRLLELEQKFRNQFEIPAELMVVPVLIPEKNAKEYREYFGSIHYYLACRDSTRYVALPEVAGFGNADKLIKRDKKIESQYEEFKALVGFK